ncbi:TonB-dependent receptor [Piscinibacter sp. XHJ-5]|uniref:TonB-dependent receptor plug domain-containing protein n=1 Tax=Piscinibacter sp. XHJ-5 TaxID=3037797 RepID=UPI0024532ADD|nr:TonB-dependent receptor [Piscinibacter sp. XHJ-5]
MSGSQTGDSWQRMGGRAAAVCTACGAQLAAAQLERTGSELAAQRLEPVQVTGSRLPRAAVQSAQDVHTYERERIERSGQTSVADFLATVPEASLNSLESTFIGTSVRLRGAREGSTLILINGRRTHAVTGGVAPFGFFDLNTIPLSMVERIDVLPSGSSAIYGGEALAGVVNIVLRSEFHGAEATLGYKGAKNTDEKNVSLGAGWKRDAVRLSIMGLYSERSAMHGRDREITASPDYRRFGGPNLGSPFFGTPANVVSVSGNLPGLNASFAAVPVGSSGIGLRPADFAATAGMQNTGSFTSYQSLVPASRRTGVFLAGDYRLANGIVLFAEMLASRYEEDVTNAPPFLQLNTVPATNAFNPFGTDVRVSGVVQGAEPLSRSSFHEAFVRPVVGARGELGNWNWEFSALASRDRGSFDVYGRPDAARLGSALASSDPRTALNPFVDGPMAGSDVLASIYSTFTPAPFKGDARLVNGFVRGPALRLPAGMLDAVVGVEVEKSTLARGFDAERTAKSLFAELRAPLLARSDERGGRRELLTLTGAARGDRYSDFGSKTTWQAGMELRPVEPLVLRGTVGTAFKPPTLYNLAAPLVRFSQSAVDPVRNGETVIVQQIQGGNPALQPTTGRSATLGLVWSPQNAGALNLSLTAWTLRIDNAINLPGGQFIVDNESLYPGRVVRGPSTGGQPGPIVTVDGTYINFGAMRQEGIDASVDWNVKTTAGVFTPAIAATYMTKFNGASTPGGADVDRLSRAKADGIFAPRLKATASLGWKPDDALDVYLAARHVGRYTDYTPPRTLGNVWYLDASIEVAVGRMLGGAAGMLSAMSLRVGATNLADKLPPYSTHFRGYDVYNYDLVGRTIYVRLRLQT